MDSSADDPSKRYPILSNEPTPLYKRRNELHHSSLLIKLQPLPDDLYPRRLLTMFHMFYDDQSQVLCSSGAGNCY